MNQEGLLLDLVDKEWPLTTIDHDRMIARAIVVDDDDNFYFVRANRDDDFGKATPNSSLSSRLIAVFKSSPDSTPPPAVSISVALPKSSSLFALTK